jgi:hypothetical protein
MKLFKHFEDGYFGGDILHEKYAGNKYLKEIHFLRQYLFLFVDLQKLTIKLKSVFKK